MRKLLLSLTIAALCQVTVFGQKKYEMVVEKTDGTEATFQVEIIKRVYFRDENGSGDSQPEDPSVDPPVSYTSCPDGNHPHMIDLGLPSGTQWACCNVGANAPEDYGGFYAWGETQTKSTGAYVRDSYQYYNSSTGWVDIGSDIAGTQYDAATANWGAPWRMPSYEQCCELVNTPSMRTSLNGVNGRRFFGPNGCTIFLPFAGHVWHGRLESSGGSYWSSTLHDTTHAYELDAGSISIYVYYNGSVEGRTQGYSVRPVRYSGGMQPKEPYNTTCPDGNHPHWIDLGLPSGTQWRCCNEGASVPEDYGGYYTFGQVDSAPTLDQIKELSDNCSFVLCGQNGVGGAWFIGPNGRTIFLPIAGYVQDGELCNPRTDGYYWSSTPYDGLSAYNLKFDSLLGKLSSGGRSGRSIGQSVRPVRQN